MSAAVDTEDDVAARPGSDDDDFVYASPGADAAVLADARTLDALDFASVRAMVARHTMTDRATARAAALAPHVDLALVREEQAATAELRRIVSVDGFALSRTRDVGEALAHVARGGALSGEDLRDVGAALAAADAAVRRVRGSHSPVMQARCADAHALPEVAAAIERAVGDRGEVLDRASPALGRVRRAAAHAQDDARDRCAAIVRSPRYAKAIQDAIVTVRDGRYVIPVKAEFQNAVPGVVHDTSSTGHTLFVEPLDALDVNNRVRQLRLEEEREVGRVLAELSALVGRKAGQGELNLEALAAIDLSLARVRVAIAMDAVAPVIVDEPRVDVRSGRHPLLGARAVAQSLALDDDTRFILISGPNMGGKTVALKMLGLYVAMAYCGMQLPAGEGTVIGRFDYLGCDIGDDQSIAENASTFSAHLRRLRTIVAASGPGALVLVDEIASGTEPASSAALGVAFVEHLLERGAHGVVTTHSTELKLFAHAARRVQNASVRFDPATYAPTYELDLGAPGQSLAFPLARALGTDPGIVARAESLLSTSERDYDRALAELADVRTQAAAERDELRRERARIAGLEAQARERGDALERERRTLARQADERIGRALREFTAELDRRQRERGASGGRPKVTSGQAALLGRVLDDVHKELGIEPGRPAAAAPVAKRPHVVKGDLVHVEALGSEGTVVEVFADSVLVTVGAMRTTVPKAGLRVTRRASARSENERPRAAAQTGEATLEAASNARAELDVRGKRFTEAEPIVDKWIDESMLLGVPAVRLIHGKGTGLLGRGLQEWLHARPGVASVRYGNADEGGSGVSIVELG